MHKRAWAFALMVVLGPALAGCDASPTETAPDLFAETFLNAVVDEGVLDHGNPPGFDEILAEVPGFAGYWWDRGCNLNVNLVYIEYADRVIELLTPYFEARIASAPQCPRDAAILVHAVEYSWDQLVEFLRLARELHRIEGVERIGIHIPENRIVVQVTGRRVAAQVLEALPTLGIPASVVKFVLSTEWGGRSG